MTGPVVTVWWSRVADDPRGRAHALLVRAAATVLGWPAEAITVDREPGGRPCLGGAAAALHVGLSHCDTAVAVALSPLAPVGVDIEPVRALRPVSMAWRWFTPAEARWVDRQPVDEQARAFLRLWTCKEAIGKAYGTGLRAGGLRRPVDPDLLTPRPAQVTADPQMVVQVPVIADDLVLTVAWTGDASRAAPVTLREVGGG